MHELRSGAPRRAGCKTATYDRFQIHYNGLKFLVRYPNIQFDFNFPAATPTSPKSWSSLGVGGHAAGGLCFIKGWKCETENAKRKGGVLFSLQTNQREKGWPVLLMSHDLCAHCTAFNVIQFQHRPCLDTQIHPQIPLCKKKILHHIKMPAYI
jgi:hypothetical protein